MDLQFRAVLSAISELRVQAELTNVKLPAALSERVAVLEAKACQRFPADLVFNRGLTFVGK
jgi:hypothetical protein